MDIDRVGFDLHYEVTKPLALVARGDLESRRYRTPAHGTYGEITDNTPQRLLGGLTAKLGPAEFRLLAGRGTSNHDKRPADSQTMDDTPKANDSFSGLLLDLGATWKIADNNTLGMGLVDDFEDSLFCNYVSYRKLYLSYRGELTRRFRVDMELAYHDLTYAQLPRTFLYNPASDLVTGILGNGWDREDNLKTFRLGIEADLLTFLALRASYRLEEGRGSRSTATFGIRSTDEQGKTIEDFSGYKRGLAALELELHF